MPESEDRIGEIIDAIASLSTEESRVLAERIRESENKRVRSFRILVCNPWMINRASFLLLQVVWVVVAALSLIAGIYLLTPAYAISGENAGELMKSFLEAVAQNPELLKVADPVMKLLGFAMLVVAVVAFYQAHLLRQAYDEYWGGGE
ncbi:MAG: hypothetical protein J7L91_00315 [Candidatus Korarchaeota archaeon]|nr:hypothetical protein [Candidatus Korarchaeota archaeon]